MTMSSSQLACRSPLYESPSTLLPENIAEFVTAASLATRLSLRCSSLVVDAVFEGAKSGTTFSLGLSRSALTRAFMTAKRVHALSMSEGDTDADRGFLQRLDRYTNMGLHLVHNTFSLAELFALSGLQMTSQTIKSGLKAAEESVRVFDGIFGANDTSRAIASFIDLIHRQLMQDPDFELARSGKVAMLAGLTKALTAFAVLQSVTHQRRMKQVKLTILWQGIVVEEEEESGQTIIEHQASSSDHTGGEHSDIAEDMQHYLYQTTYNESDDDEKHSECLVPSINHTLCASELPSDAMYEISTLTTCTTTRTTRFQPIDQTKDKADQPKAKHIITNTKEQMQTSYLATVGKDSHGSNEIPTDKPSGYWQYTLSALSRMISHKKVERQEKYERAISSVDPSTQAETPESDDMIAGPITTMTSTSTTMRSTAAQYSLPHQSQIPLNPADGITRRHSGSWSQSFHRGSVGLNRSVRSRLDRRRHSSASYLFPPAMDLFDTDACAPATLPRARERSNSLASVSSLSRTHTTTTYTTTPQLLRSLAETKDGMTMLDNDTLPNESPRRLLRPTSNKYLAYPEQQRPTPPNHLIKNLLRFMRYASAAYGESFMRILGIGDIPSMLPRSHHHHPNHHAFAHHTGVPVQAILLSSYTDYSPLQMHHPSSQALIHYVVVDHAAKSIVLACRGTLGISDVLTDLTCTYADFEVPTTNKTFQFTAHGGMLNAAQRLAQQNGKVYQAVREGLQQYPDYGLVLCGHSLGGGVVSLLSVLWSEKPGSAAFVTSTASGLPVGRPIHCYAYGPPCVMSPELSEYCGQGLVTSVIHGCDFVSGLSLGVLEDLKRIATNLHMEDNVVAEILSRAVGRQPSQTGDDDQWFWSMIKTLRADMRSDKLYPPCTVYHIESVPQLAQHTSNTTASVHGASHQTRHKKAHMMVFTRCDDVQARFSEITFSRSMFMDHSPSMYEKALWQLHRGYFGQQDASLQK